MYIPEMIVWELTRACNAYCKHCATDAGKVRDKELSTNEAFKLIEELKEAGTKYVYLSGGEPTLRKDFYEIIEKICDEGMAYGFVTNGLNMLDYEFLKNRAPKSIGVSIDGAEKTHNEIRGVINGYKRTWDNIKEGIKNEMPIAVITAVSKYNYKDLELIEFDLLTNRVPVWQVQAVIPEGRMKCDNVISEEEYYNLCKYIYSQRPKVKGILEIVAADNLGYHGSMEPGLHLNPWTGCLAGKSVAGIESDGGVKACLSIELRDAIVGNIRESSFNEIWNDDSLFAFFREDTPLSGKCKDCEHGGTCGGGCMATSLGFNQEFKKEARYCILDYEKSFNNENRG